MQKLKNQVEFVFCVDDIQQPREGRCRNGGERAKPPDDTGQKASSLLPSTSHLHTYLTIFGWLSSLSREISRIAVLGTPSVSLGEIGKQRWECGYKYSFSPSPGILFPLRRHHPASPSKVRGEKVCCSSFIHSSGTESGFWTYEGHYFFPPAPQRQVSKACWYRGREGHRGNRG